MSIIYALAAQGTKVLCDYSSFSGNFAQMCVSILKRVPQNTRGTYGYDDNYCFHFLNAANMTYLTMCETKFPATTAFQFLESIKSELEQAHGTNFDGTSSYGLQRQFQSKIAMKIDYFNKNKDTSTDNISRLKNEVINVRDELLKDDEILNQRGEKIQLIVEKADKLSQHSDSYYNSSKKVRKSFWMRKMKLIIALTITILVIILVIVLIACGGFKFSKCK